jgi:hypothetical protein
MRLLQPACDLDLCSSHELLSKTILDASLCVELYSQCGLIVPGAQRPFSQPALKPYLQNDAWQRC